MFGGGAAGSGLVSLHVKGTPAGESFTVAGNWLALEGAVSLRISKTLDGKASEIQKPKRHDLYMLMYNMPLMTISRLVYVFCC